ncbi:Sco1p [Sugiyamaella lignohabitans]|uniref:Sco1p n=1 Tax=Sugiyamaella lignohabitans TaxID=796027 RepID=A0A167DGD1_9ASCO|nr:Sco1p [Sugiyamaella lignohabitans]ANB12886.1 Sco1p [Sugiyamaella lignohabitans]
MSLTLGKGCIPWLGNRVLITGARSSRLISSCRPLLNSSKVPGSSQPDQTNQTIESNESKSSASHIADNGTARHGFDPKKPRKPLSRIALGQEPGKQGPISSARQPGFINWTAAGIFLAVGGGLTWYFQREKKRIAIRKEEEANQSVGMPSIGGPFSLIDQNGNKFTDKDMLGKFALLYFGFSMCPDICPEELENMSNILDDINKPGEEHRLLPVFITCDPNRDSPEVLKAYLAEFHPDIIGLTGSYEDIKQTCKEYRVYFSTPPDLKAGDEYLVDHSIFFYLMDPEGRFVEALGKNYTPEQVNERIKSHMDAWVPQSQREQKSKGFLSGLFS